MVSALSQARLARWEVKGQTALIALTYKDIINKVTVGNESLMPGDLVCPGAAFTGLDSQERGSTSKVVVGSQMLRPLATESTILT